MMDGAGPVEGFSSGRREQVSSAVSLELTSERVVPRAPTDDRKDVTCCCLDSIIPSTFSSSVPVNSSNQNVSFSQGLEENFRSRRRGVLQW